MNPIISNTTIFSGTDGAIIGRMNGKAVMVEKIIGKGTILVTTIHEYPSRCFIAGFSVKAGETFFLDKNEGIMR